jgi:hypothetical protein
MKYIETRWKQMFGIVWAFPRAWLEDPNKLSGHFPNGFQYAFGIADRVSNNH